MPKASSKVLSSKVSSKVSSKAVKDTANDLSRVTGSSKKRSSTSEGKLKTPTPRSDPVTEEDPSRELTFANADGDSPSLVVPTLSSPAASGDSRDNEDDSQSVPDSNIYSMIGKKINCFYFNWAGGTSLVYSQLISALTDKCRKSAVPFRLEHKPIDLPGRFFRQKERAIVDIPELAASLVQELFEKRLDENNDEAFVLFGHSYGSIVAFETAKYLQENNMKKPLALFVSASRPPSSKCLTSESFIPVSEMKFDEMMKYFQDRGSSLTKEEFMTDELKALFVGNVRVDYKGLENYVSNDTMLSLPIVSIGGSSDPIVSSNDLSIWGRHCESTFTSFVLQDKGHFYLNDDEACHQLASIFLNATQKILHNEIQDIMDSLITIFAKVLNVDATLLSPDSHFFQSGGSSLDTIALISQIKGTLNIVITQDEIFLHPKIECLALRLRDIQATSKEAPSLEPIDGSSTWGRIFPASHGQEQMISCWEMAPTMYNMPTTIEFTRESIDIAILHEAFLLVIRNQHSLRTLVKVDTSSNSMHQYVLSVSDADKCVELKSLQAKNQDEARAIIERESSFVFPLYDIPVVRAVVVKVANGSDLLLLNQHHVGSDGWSRTILRRQLLKSYMALRNKTVLPEELTIPLHPNYIDWTIWSHRYLTDFKQEAKQLEYWRSKLHNLPVLDLPTDKPRPKVLSSQGMRLPIIISKEITEKFTELVVERGASLYAGLIALYVLMLHRMGGGDDFSIGIALANRHHEGLQDLIGYFANEVAIRAQFDEAFTFQNILANTYTNILEGMAHADTPFHKVTEALRIPRSSNRTSVFQAMFALQEREWHSLDDLCPTEGDLKFQLKHFNHNTSKFEVHLQLRHDGSGGLEGDLHIATDLFTEESGKRMVSMYKTLMKNCMENPDIGIRHHDLVSGVERGLVASTNATSKEYTIHSLFQFLTVADPSSDAIYCDGTDNPITSHGDLQQLIRHAAGYLQKNVGLMPNMKVGLVINSSVYAIASIFGIILSGSAIVVLDAEKTPVSRCKMIFEDAGVSAVLIENKFLTFFEEDLKVDTWEVIALNELFLSKYHMPIEYQDFKKDDLFGIFYTSGSTGTPKGALITHGNVLNLTNWWVDFFDLHSSDNILLFSSLSFIMSLRQYIPTLCAGGTVVIPKSSIEFESAIMNAKVSKLICTPSALAALDIDNATKSVRYVQVAGEAPRLSTLLEWNNCIDKLFVGLGPTELCAHALCGEFDGKTLCIGFPANNVKAYVVDDKSALQCPINVPGELWIAGKNVCKGYLNREELTSSKFCLDPFVSKGAERLYRTGDLAKRLPDGRIQFIGRRDNQLKINGFRIEAGEIINAIPDGIVKHAHVLLEAGKLILFITPSVNVEQVKQALSSSLPSYMVPHYIFPLDEFPLNKNRKLDLAELSQYAKKAMETSSVDSNMISSRDSPSFSRVEEAISFIWAQHLQTPVVNMKRDSNFFELGGTSLSAVMVARALESEFGSEVGVTDVFVHQTIASLAEYLSKSTDAARYCGDPKPLHFLPGGRKELHPTLFSILQGFGLLLMSIIATVPLIGIAFLSIRSFIWFGNAGVFIFPGILCGGCLLHLALVSSCKWLVIGQFSEGKAKKFSFYFLKWWLTRRILQVPRLYTWIIDETVFSAIWLRLLGAKIGSNFMVEQPYILEPDLVSVGDDCVVEFETQFSTSEIRNGCLELRKVQLGNKVKVGTRAVLLGGTFIHDGSEIKPKSTVDYFTSTIEACQILEGSPAIVKEETTNGKEWRPKSGYLYNLAQLFGCVALVEMMTVIGYVSASIGLVVQKRYGSIGLVIYLGSMFSIVSNLLFLLTAAMMKKFLFPFALIPFKEYRGSWFTIRKWFLDRLFLSPLFSYCSQRMLQTSSTFPMYMRLLGTKTGQRAWLNHPYTRGVGTEFIKLGDDVHMGMLSYFNTDHYSDTGISFHPINIGSHSSFGQRCVCLGGVNLDSYVTVGAETILSGMTVKEGGTVFGSPPVLFTSNSRYKDIIEESQNAAKKMLEGDTDSQPRPKNEMGCESECLDSTMHSDKISVEEQKLSSISRMQDIGTGGYFWLYVLTMIIIQGSLPLLIGVAYGGIYFGFRYLFGELSFEYIIALVPAIYMIGSLALMAFMKMMHLCGGSFKIGTANFFSFRFFYWHIFADVVYLCTSTIVYPFSGTEIYCMWLRAMGAKVGKRVFVSPENGGFREIDFLNIGDDCTLMTPNIHGHYTDHGMLQFCPVILESGCEVNPGATIMPLTTYGKNCRLRPFAVTVKGQHCQEGTEYVGNPCKPLKASSEKVSILFGGQGSQYPGMLDHFHECGRAMDLLHKAEDILKINIKQLCSIDTDPNLIQKTELAQPIVAVADLMAAELMREKYTLDFSKVIACSGFSLGELSALCFAGAISFEDTLHLVKLRAEAMADCGGAMCNVKGLSYKETQRLCKRFSCSIANVICDHASAGDQNDVSKSNVYVCSGLTTSINKLVEHLNKHTDEELEQVRSKKLRVSGAFHSHHMKTAARKFEDALKSINIKLPGNCLVYSNVTGRPYSSVDEIRRLLPYQITQPVQWHKTIMDMSKIEGVTKFIECGPTDTLARTLFLVLPQLSREKVIISDSSCSDRK